MDLNKRNLMLSLMLIFTPLSVYSADLNIATIDPQKALLSTEIAKQEFEEMQNSKEWTEVAEELQAKETEAREIQEKTQKEGPTMSDEEKQEAGKRFQSLVQDIEFLRKKINKTNEIVNDTLVEEGDGDDDDITYTKLTYNNKDYLRCTMIGIGAAADYISGNKKQPNKFFEYLGLAWFIRLISEPKRLFWRYTSTNFLFIILITMQLLGLKKFK